jgi:Fe2+ transport system protein B
VADAVTWIVWIVFVFVMSLLFYATFGVSNYDEDTIDEYMQSLELQILEEQRTGRVPPT